MTLNGSRRSPTAYRRKKKKTKARGLQCQLPRSVKTKGISGMSPVPIATRTTLLCMMICEHFMPFDVPCLWSCRSLTDVTISASVARIEALARRPRPFADHREISRP